MQTRQTQIDKLPEEEKKIQDHWARSLMEEKMKGSCNRGFSFIKAKSGYVCAGAGHFVPHALVLKGGFYKIRSHGGTPATTFTLAGPFYSENEARDMTHKGHRNPLRGETFRDVWKVWADVQNGRYERDGRERR
jgi:hypothetical protein